MCRSNIIYDTLSRFKPRVADMFRALCLLSWLAHVDALAQCVIPRTGRPVPRRPVEHIKCFSPAYRVIHGYTTARRIVISQKAFEEDVRGTGIAASRRKKRASLFVSLTVGLFVLLLLPAQVFHLPGSRPYIAFVSYLGTFSFGALQNVTSKGKQPQSSESSKKRGRPPVLAPLAIVSLHWLAVCEGAKALAGGCSLATALGLCCIVFGSVLNVTSLARLGKNFAAGGLSKAAVPAALVTTGPYRFVRHPIYTSYLFIFGGCFLFLGAPICTLAGTLLGYMYYSKRASKEDELLSRTFPDEHPAYLEQTHGALLPCWSSPTPGPR
eukprot:TRINITY_DN26033_c0_g1_i3.p1 TRINITY_DN26033_c0_g1~~TRINITY_DN26033_c0_g1_i3.p1  ORF type:complete len:325 (+),score=0.91 TRINITY_DN26033_c0_g1_i3:163-1137(+)